MKAFRTVIAFPFPRAIDDSGNYIQEIQYLPIDYLEDRKITARSKIVTQPLQNGDTMADHMYREPVSVTLSGKFSLNGRNWNNDSYNLMFKNDRLTSIEYVFEYIKNNGTLCTLTTIECDIDGPDKIIYDEDGNFLGGSINPSNTRFLTRENMALEDISWTEKVNSLDFSFGFKEIIMVDQMEFEFYDASDLLLPSLNEPQAQGVGSILFDTGELSKAVMKMFYDNGYIKDDWMKAVVDGAETVAVAVVALVTVAIAVGIALSTLGKAVAVAAAAKGALVTVGAVAGGVVSVVGIAVIAVAAIGLAIFWAIQHEKQREKEKLAFKLINGDYKQDLNRYMNLMDDLESAVNKAGSKLSLYQISSDEEQEICLAIGGNYYYISFTKTNVFPFWKSDVRLNAPSSKDGSTQISNMRLNFPVVDNFIDLNENVNMWFKDETKEYQVYIVNPSLNDQYNGSKENKEEVAKKLSSYTIWISKGSMKEQVNNVQNALIDAIHEHGFN